MAIDVKLLILEPETPGGFTDNRASNVLANSVTGSTIGSDMLVSFLRCVV